MKSKNNAKYERLEKHFLVNTGGTSEGRVNHQSYGVVHTLDPSEGDSAVFVLFSSLTKDDPINTLNLEN